MNDMKQPLVKMLNLLSRQEALLVAEISDEPGERGKRMGQGQGMKRGQGMGMKQGQGMRQGMGGGKR